MVRHWINLAFWLACILLLIQPMESKEHVIKRSPRLDKWTHSIRGDYIPMEFFNAMRSADLSKQSLQNQLRNFLENLQKNLTTSEVQNIMDDIHQTTQNQIVKFRELSNFFYLTAEVAKTFSHDSEMYYEVAKTQVISFCCTFARFRRHCLHRLNYY